MAGEALKLSVQDLLYLCVFSISFWTVLLTLQCLLQHPSVTSILTRPSIAVTVFQAVAMPPHGATTIGVDPRLCVMAATPSISILFFY